MAGINSESGSGYISIYIHISMYPVLIGHISCTNRQLPRLAGRRQVVDIVADAVANLPPSQDANLPVDSDSDSEDAGGGSPSVTGIDPEESDSAG